MVREKLQKVGGGGGKSGNLFFPILWEPCFKNCFFTQCHSVDVNNTNLSVLIMQCYLNNFVLCYRWNNPKKSEFPFHILPLCTNTGAIQHM